MISAPDGDPFGQNVIIQRKIQHIDHFPVKKRSVASIFGQKSRYLPKAIVKNDSVKNGIYNISQGTCKNKTDAQNQYPRCIFADGIPKPIANSTNCDNPEKCQDQFSVSTRNLCAPGHSFIFDKKNP